MATILKISCPQCGQRVSGDESFYGVVVDCPVCAEEIPFPENPEEEEIGASQSADDEDGADNGNGAERSENADAPESPTSRGTPQASPGVSPSTSPGELSGGAAALREEEPLPLTDSAPFPASGSEPGARPEETPGAFSRATRRGSDFGGYPGEDYEEEAPSPLLGAVSLVSGVLGLVTFCAGGILFAPLAIIFGHTALARGSHSSVQPAPGKGLATAGVMIGYFNLLVLIVALVAAVIFGEDLRDLWRGRFG